MSKLAELFAKELQRQGGITIQDVPAKLRAAVQEIIDKNQLETNTTKEN